MFVCVYVCMSVRLFKHFASGDRAAGQIGTGQYSFDAPEWRKDVENSFGPIGCTWHVPRATAQTLANSTLQVLIFSDQATSQPRGALQSRAYVNFRDALQNPMHLLVSGAPFMLEVSYIFWALSVFQKVLQPSRLPQGYGEAFSFLDAPAKLRRHPGS